MNAADRLGNILATMEKCRKQSPLAARRVTLIAVSKTHPAEDIIPLIEAGHRIFGENRVQEAAAKWPRIRERFPDIELHLIGSLQSNKVRDALQLFDAIHTLDRESLVQEAVKECAKGRPVRCRQFFVQVNTGEEPQKGGVTPETLPALMQYIKRHAGPLPVNGLMCVPPAHVPPAPHFALLHKIAREYGLEHLSMGMSGDFETAIRLGATHIRIGTALFGERK